MKCVSCSAEADMVGYPCKIVITQKEHLITNVLIYPTERLRHMCFDCAWEWLSQTRFSGQNGKNEKKGKFRCPDRGVKPLIKMES